MAKGKVQYPRFINSEGAFPPLGLKEQNLGRIAVRRRTFNKNLDFGKGKGSLCQSAETQQEGAQTQIS